MVEGIESVPLVCVSVCLSVSELSHGWTGRPKITKFGIVWLTFMKSRPSSMVKIIGQRSRSVDWKKHLWTFLKFQMGWPMHIHFVLSYDLIWCYGVTSWHHTTLRCDAAEALSWSQTIKFPSNKFDQTNVFCLIKFSFCLIKLTFFWFD